LLQFEKNWKFYYFFFSAWGNMTPFAILPGYRKLVTVIVSFSSFFNNKQGFNKSLKMTSYNPV